VRTLPDFAARTCPVSGTFAGALTGTSSGDPSGHWRANLFQ
jgi:hypothetical protein